MLKLILFIFTFFVAACSSLPKVERLPPQEQSVRTFKVEHQQQQSLLTVQFEQSQWRWVQTTPLGSPIARVLLTAKGWQNDGFVMPNRQAQQWFSVLANALNPNYPPFMLDDGYQLKSQPPYYSIRLPDGSVWEIEELAF